VKQHMYIAVAAVTIDGKIARHPAHFSNWTSKEDKSFLHEFLDACDCIIVGRKTYELAKEPLSKRRCVVLTRRVKGIEET
jgi:dihydrofolate reductase